MLIDPATILVRPSVSRGEATGTQLEHHSITQRWQVNVTSNQATLNFPITYWPDWQAFIDDQPIETHAAPDSGYLQIDVPRGEHRVDLRLSSTSIRAVSEIISLIAWIVVLIALVPLLRAVPWRHIVSQVKASTALAVLIVGAGFVLFVITAQSAHAIAPNENDLTMDFVSQPWLHHNPGGYAFRGDARLEKYELEVDADAIQANLWWNSPLRRK
jgi:hypothetical protein